MAISTFVYPGLAGVAVHGTVKITPTIMRRVDPTDKVKKHVIANLGQRNWDFLRDVVFDNAGISTFAVTLLKKFAPKSQDPVSIQAGQYTIVFLGVCTITFLIKKGLYRVAPIIKERLFAPRNDHND